MLKRLCVFCGSRTGKRAVFGDSARQLGRLMVEHGWDLVYGGGNIGIMGILADAVLLAGGQVTGVIPKALKEKELAHESIGILHVVETMHQRKALMADLAHAFAALPGGFGTCDELFEILTWAQLGLHARPIGLLNVDGFFDPISDWLDLAVREGLLHSEHRRLLVQAARPEDLLKLLELPPAKPSVEKWIEPNDR